MDINKIMTLIITLLSVVVIVIMEVNGETALRWKIPVGTISDESDVMTYTGFYYSVAMLKKQPFRPFDLITPVETIDKTNSFQLAQAICRQMSIGIFALFGTKSYRSQDILTSYANKFHMPYVTVSSVMEKMAGSYELHMKPPLTRVLRDLIVSHNWNNISYVYDSDAGLLRYQELGESLYSVKPSLKLTMRRLRDVNNSHDDLRALDTETRFGIKYILVDLESEESYDILLKQIREVGMNKDNYFYILASQDILSLPVERFRHGGVHIIGFQLVDYSSYTVKRFINKWSQLSSQIWPGAGSDTIRVGAALAIDAANILHETMTNMVNEDPDVFRTTFRRSEIYNYNTTKGIPCSAGIPWMHGNELIKRMKGMKFHGLTGSVDFDQNGVRKNFKLGVYQVSLDFGPTEIGEWNTISGYKPKGQGKKEVIEKEMAPRNVKIVISVLESPFFMLKTELPKNGSNWTGNARYEGFSVDLIEAVAKICNFEYVLTHSPDGVYGQGDPSNESSWSGLMALLINRAADISVAPLTITKDRQNVVDFSEPFMNSGISIMIKIPDIQKPGVFAFMQPFSVFLWLCIVISYFVVSIGIFLVGRFSPSEWDWAKSLKSSVDSFDLASSFWFTMGSMMLQGSDTCPRSNAGRIVGGAWWFVVLISISSYTANLAAFLTIEKLLTPIESTDDLAKQTYISYGTLDSGASQDFFRKSEVPVYRTMWNYMHTAEPSVFVKSMPEGVERVRNNKGRYAFLLESVYNEYFNYQDPCNTMQVGPNLNNKGYGLATPKGSELRDEISIAVLQLKENGLLIKLKNKWWVEKGGCGMQDTHSKSKKRSLSLNKVAGVFFILIGGLVFAIIIGVIHFHKTKIKVQKLDGFFLFGTEMKTTADIEYTRCPSENSNGRILSNGRSNGDKPLAGYDDHQDLGVPDLDQHVCQAIDNSYHGNRHDPVKRLNARKKS